MQNTSSAAFRRFHLSETEIKNEGNQSQIPHSHRMCGQAKYEQVWHAPAPGIGHQASGIRHQRNVDVALQAKQINVGRQKWNVPKSVDKAWGNHIYKYLFSSNEGEGA